MDIGPEGRHKFRAEWERWDETLTQAELYDAVPGTAQWTRAGKITVKWQRPSAIGPTPPVIGGLVRAASQQVAMAEFSELVKLEMKLEIEGHTLWASTNKLTKEAMDVIFPALWDGRHVYVRIGLENFPIPSEVHIQHQR